MNSGAGMLQAIEHMADQIDHPDVVALVPACRRCAFHVLRGGSPTRSAAGTAVAPDVRLGMARTARVVRVSSRLFLDVRRDKSLNRRTITNL
jgi:hypothetical protein